MQKRFMYIAILLLAICNKIVAEDLITISDIIMYSGGTKEVNVVMTNTDSYVGFQFDLVLPEGITIESFSASERIPQGTSLQMAQQTDGSYRFIAYAQNRLPITGNDGAIMTLTIKASESVVSNSYSGYLRDVKISTVDGTGPTVVEQSFSITVKGAEPYAALSENNTVLTFYYDKKKEEHGGMSVGPFSGYVQRGWHSVRSSIAKVVFDDSFAMYSPTSTALWFWGLQTMTEIIGLENLHTDQVTDMNGMFHYCYALETLDLSNFNTAAVTNIAGMFYGCNKLKTITVGEGWTTDNIITTTISGTGGNGGWQVFSQCTSLVGGAGTKFDASHTDYTYAHIDGGPSNPGYLTEKLDYNDGDLFTAKTIEGVTLTFVVTNASEKKCFVASNDRNTYMDTSTTGVVTIPSIARGYTVEALSNGAFKGCASVTEFKLPETLVLIECDAFRNCTGLTTVHIPASVTGIENQPLPWPGCTGITSITVDPENPIFDSRDNCNAIFTTADSTLYVGCKVSTIPESTRSIGHSAFDSMGELPALVLPAGLRSITAYAFWACSFPSVTSYIEEPFETSCVWDHLPEECPLYVPKGKVDAYRALSEWNNFTTIVEIGSSITPEPYAVLSEDNTVLTFYYDDQKAVRGGIAIGSYGPANYEPWYENRTTLTTAVFDESFANDTTLTSTAYWFHECIKLTEIKGLEYLKTDKVTDMRNMFYGCSKLTTLDVSHFKTGNVTNMNLMFYYCSGLTSLDVKGFNTENVTDMGSMFNNCSGLKSLDISSFKTEKVKNMIQMFYQCYNLTTIYVGNGWSTASVTADYGYHMFTDCTALVGGMGTTYDENHVDFTYAHIDEGPSNPGYFTEKVNYNDGDIFTAETVEGIMLKYRVISEADKTCQVGTMVDTDSWISSDIANAVDDPMVEGTITIPEYAKGYRVIKIGYEAFINCTQVTSIVIPNTVTEITTAAMAQSGLTAITIPSSVSSIHYDFLHNCSNLESIVVEEGNQVYDSRNSCNALIETATNKLMMGCKTSTVPNGIETIGTAAFILCKGLTAIELPNTVTRIETQAFNSSDLSSINLPPSLEYIGYSCFAGANVTSFVIPASVKEIMLGAFNCNGLTSIVVEQGNQVYDSRDNCNAIIETATNTLFEGFSVTVIPNSVTAIGSSAFREVWGLHEITIPESVAAIGEHAFIHTYLEKVTSERPEPVEIPDNAFSDNCYEQATLYVPQSSIEAYSTTGGWKNFKSILAIVEGGTAEPYAVLSEDSLTVTFYYDDQKTSRGGMDINNSILDNSNSPYGTATSAVFDVSFDAYRPTSTACWFENCSSLATINGIEYLHTDDVTNMSWMFECCFNLEELDLSNFNTSNVTEMYGMFLSCQGLKSLNVSSFNTSKVVGMNQMFCGLSNLMNLDLSNFDTSNVRWMYAMFADCQNLTSLDISSFNSALVSNMGDLFSNCVKLKTIYVGDGWATTGVEENGDRVFDNCTSLVGGKGTVYDANRTDYTYAHIDGGPSNPGYFTDKNAQADDGLELYAIDVESEMKSNETFMPTQSVKMTLGNDSEWSTNNDLAPELGGELKFDANIYYPGIYNKNYAFVSSAVGTNNPAAGPLVDGMSTGSSYKPRWRNLPESGAYFIFESEQDGSLIVPIRINPNKPLYVTDDAGVPLIAYQLKDQDGVTVALDANSSTAEKTIAFLSLNVSKNQKYYIFCKGSKPRVGGYIFAPYTIDIDPATTAAALDSLLAEPVDATFDSNGVLSAGGGTTMADALEYVGGRAEVAKTITAIVWNSTATLTNDDLQGLDNPNMLIYVKDAALAPANRDNVVIGDFAKNIVLMDVSEGNGNFYCPQAFTAEKVNYVREFRQQTQVGVSRGWESIALPFTVQTISHEKQGAIAPFGNSASTKHFWLRRLGDSGLTQATVIEANIPYIISMPNDNVNYAEEFNLSGRVTFAAQEVTIPVTEPVTLALADSTIKMVPAFHGIGRASDVWAINVGESRDQYLEGSVFERDYREVRPFEAYTVHTGEGPAPRFVLITEIGGTTGIEDVRGLMSDGRGDKWYDLNGRRLQQKPTQKGVYLNNGRKVIIR